MASTASISNYRLTDHVKLEMTRRQISEAEVAGVLSSPEQIESVSLGRKVYQSRVDWGRISRPYLLRVVLDIDREPPVVVTVYRTSKVNKYWRVEQ
jgi:hypothetical protein